jgi:hypothetical protein
MNTLKIPSGRNHAGLELKPIVRILIAYEDYATGLRARQVYERLAREFAEHCDFEQTLWRIDVLSVPQLGEVAADEAVGADMLLISLHKQEELTDVFKDWCEKWVDRDVKLDTAMVVVFDPDTGGQGGDSPAQEYLRCLANRAGMSFIAQEVPNDATSAGQRLSRHDSRQRWRHWGIND